MDSVAQEQIRKPTMYGKYDNNPNENSVIANTVIEEEIQEEPVYLVKETTENITYDEEEPMYETPLPSLVPVIENKQHFEEEMKPKTRRTRRKSPNTKKTTQTEKTTQKKKRCKKGSRRNRKTKRCRKKCEPGYKRNKSKRCVKR